MKSVSHAEKRRRILNIGCGRSTYGTDFVDLYPSRPEIKKVDIDSQRLPYPNDKFDEVFSENVFEHLTNPGNFLKECHRVLKKGGKIIVITDNANYYGWAIKKTHLGGYEKKSESNDRHYTLFTDWHMKNHLVKQKFKNVKVEFLPSNILTVLGFFGFVLNKVLDLTPLYRMGHSKLKAEGTK